MNKLVVVILAAFFSQMAFAADDACSKLKATECKKNAECVWKAKAKKCDAKPASKSEKAGANKASTGATSTTTPPPDSMPADEGEDLEDL